MMKTEKRLLNVEELHSLSMECSRIPFLPPPSYGSDDEYFEDGISDGEDEEEDREKGNGVCSENSGDSSDDNGNTNSNSTDSSDNDDDNDDNNNDSRLQNSVNGDSNDDSNDDNDDDGSDGGDNVIKKIGNGNEDDNECVFSNSPTANDGYDHDSGFDNSDGDRNLSTTEKNDVKDNFEAIISKALKTSTDPSPSHSAITQAAPVSINHPMGVLLYTPNSLSEKDLKQHGLTQLEIIQIPDNSIDLKSGSSKRGSSSVPQTGKSEKTKKTRRAENVGEIDIKPKLNLEDKTAHLDITLPDEVDIFSLVIYTSSGIRNSLLLPLSTAPFRKLVDLTTAPKRNKTRVDWERIKSKSLSYSLV